MRKTKLYPVKDRGNNYGLWVEENGKYKLIFKHPKISVVKRKRAEVQSESINVKAVLAKKTFVEVYAEFAAYKLDEANDSKHGVKYESVISYTHWLNKYIKPYFSNRVLLADISPHLHAIPFFKRIREDDVGATWLTAENVVKSFKTCLNYAVERQYLIHTQGFEKFSPRKSSALKSKKPEEMKHKRTPMITLDEAIKLFNHLIPKDKDIKQLQRFAVVSTFIFTGMRMSELRGLRWDYINFETEKYEIAKTVVRSQMYDSVKADGSPRTNIIHPTLLIILKAWKKSLSLHFTPRKVPLVFPSLSNRGTINNAIIPICDRTVNDWLKLAYHDLGFAVVEMVKNKSGDSKHYVRTVSSKFGNNPSRTFRHFAATSLLDNQHAFPVLTDNFVKGYIGHKDIRMTRWYGDHNDRNTTRPYEEKQKEALKKSIPISLENNLN